MRRSAAIAVIALSIAVAPPSAAGIDCRPLRAQYEGKHLFLQHNLRFEDEDASWVNFVLGGNFHPVGSPVRVLKVKEDEVILMVEGRGEKLQVDMSDGEPTCAVILTRMLGPQPPDLSGLSELDVTGIKRGSILVGMSRRAVFLAVGYPPHYYQPAFVGADKNAINHDPNADVLTYMGSTWDFIPVTFANDVVTGIGD
jgi:hypothetical protein